MSLIKQLVRCNNNNDDGLDITIRRERRKLDTSSLIILHVDVRPSCDDCNQIVPRTKMNIDGHLFPDISRLLVTHCVNGQFVLRINDSNSINSIYVNGTVHIIQATNLPNLVFLDLSHNKIVDWSQVHLPSVQTFCFPFGNPPTLKACPGVTDMICSLDVTAQTLRNFPQLKRVSFLEGRIEDLANIMKIDGLEIDIKPVTSEELLMGKQCLSIRTDFEKRIYDDQFYVVNKKDDAMTFEKIDKLGVLTIGNYHQELVFYTITELQQYLIKVYDICRKTKRVSRVRKIKVDLWGFYLENKLLIDSGNTISIVIDGRYFPELTEVRFRDPGDAFRREKLSLTVVHCPKLHVIDTGILPVTKFYAQNVPAVLQVGVSHNRITDWNSVYLPSAKRVYCGFGSIPPVTSVLNPKHVICPFSKIKIVAEQWPSLHLNYTVEQLTALMSAH